jgi:hypothetical protein
MHPAIMQRTDPPVISIVGTSKPTMRAEPSISLICAAVKLATARDVIRQQQQIDLLMREVAALRQPDAEVGAAVPRNLRDELPPHF